MKLNRPHSRKHRGTSTQRLPSRPSSRRGVLLLVVLAMLTLFLLIGTAFIVSSNQFRVTSKSRSMHGQQENLRINQESFLGEVINQIIRDTGNQNSALRFHSLLRDLYGTDGIVVPSKAQSTSTTPPLPPPANVLNNFSFAGTADGLGNVTGGQFLEFTLPNNYEDLQGRTWFIEGASEQTKPYSPIDNYYKGQTVTFIDGPARGHTTRIVGYDAATRRVRILNFPGENGHAFTDQAFLDRLNGASRIVINGRPFNGTGVGYNPLAPPGGPKLDTVEVLPTASGPLNVPIALAPNAAFFVPEPGVNVPEAYFSTNWANLTAAQRQALVNNMGFEGQGGSDESYDAPDFQNMFLAWTGPNVVDTVFPNLDGTDIGGTNYDRMNLPPFLGNIVLPSYHRPDLINYWANQTSGLGLSEGVPLLRKIMLRPNWHDHPGFTGSNPEYEAVTNGSDKLLRMIYGPWDVDNDMDGVRDSVWLDFGAPVMMNKQGRLVKPLAAIMVVDLDGRLNVNAHSSRDIQNNPNNFTVSLAGGVTSNNVPKGQAFGPAEISLRPVVGDRFGELLNGDIIHGVPWRGRYAADNEPGHKDLQELSAVMKLQGAPSVIPGTHTLTRSNFGSLPDFRGRYAQGLNDFGQLINEWVRDFDDNNNNGIFDAGDTGRPGARLDEDHPYELDLSISGPRGEGTAVDNPFSLAELERLLRVYDVDAASLAPRLFALLKGNRPESISPSDPDYDQLIRDYMRDLSSWRTLLTTDSYDMPEPSFQLPEWVKVGPNGVVDLPSNPDADDYAIVMGRPPVNATFADLIEYRIRLANGWMAPVQGTPDPNLLAIQRTMRILVAPEMLAGLKLDLNRPFGNGRDDNGNGVVDEPGEDEGAFWTLDSARLPAAVATGPGSPAGAFQDDAFQDNPNAAYRNVIDMDGDGVISTAEFDFCNPTTHTGRVNLHNYRRQLFARHLYVLAMAVIDPLPAPATGPSDPAYIQKLRDRARDLAQWAINVVDFRDPDNIMTAFEYDENPFLNGWAGDPQSTHPSGLIDGLINTNYPTDNTTVGRHVQLVWGTEKPEVLMTETLAWHDRWTEDGPGENPDADELDSGQKGSTDYDKDKYDRSFDQRQKPRGAAFVELYNPNAPMPGASADTHYIDGNGNDLGINLAAVSEFTRTTATNSTALPSPVWRLAVYQTRPMRVNGVLVTNAAGPDKDPDDRDRDNIPLTIDRSVYFAGFDPGYNRQHHGVAFFNSDPSAPVNPGVVDNRVPPLRPGRYMVVGAGEEVEPGKYLANFGAKTGLRTSTRGIVLNTRRSTDAVRAVELRGAGDPADPNSIVQDPAGFPVQTLPDNVLPPIPGDNSPSMTDVAIIDRFTNPRDGQVDTRPFNISEPAGGYPDRWAGSRWDGTEYTGGYIDIPLDDQRGGFTAGGGGIGGGGGGGGGIGSAPSDRKPRTDPLVDGETRLSLPGQFTLGGDGGGGIGGGGGGGPTGGSDPEQARRTIPGFSWIYLQRLANPLLAWNPLPTLPNGSPDPDHRSDLPVNPYLTVDSMGANVTVFNGLSKSEKLRTNADAQPLEFRNQWAIDSFSSVQRGRVNTPLHPALRLGDLQTRALAGRNGLGYAPSDPNAAALPSQPMANLWNPEGIGIRVAQDSAPPPQEPALAGYFRNRAGTGSGAEPNANSPDKDHHFNGIPDNTLGFLNEPFRDPAEVDPVRARVVPRQPFPTVHFANRPFANAGELAQVPAWRSSQLLQTFSFINQVAPVPVPNEELYQDDPAGGRRAIEVELSDSLKYVLDGPYGHLLNFFRTKTDGQDQLPGTPDDRGIAGLYRVLDLVSVPSLYVGNETWLNPAAFGDITTSVNSTADPRYGFQPPFNKVQSRREPGRVNINTILRDDTAKAVWDGVMHGSAKRTGNTDNSHPGPDEDALIAIRRGYGTFGDGASVLNAAYPTLLANPFRPAGTGDLVPLPNMVRLGTESTLMRTMGEKPFTNASVVPQTAPTGLPFISTEAPEAYRNSERNTNFRYSPLSRLSSMTTNRSNVFAVWVTIGFFEVEEVLPWTSSPEQLERFGTQAVYQRVYPDGYRFGKEAGIDTGEEVRYREFAIIDRTIPVGFEPGANHNTQETIRLRRKIE